jgi:hypothetical protein
MKKQKALGLRASPVSNKNKLHKPPPRNQVSSPGASQGQSNSAVQRCPMQQAIDKKLVVFDEEASGNRHFDEQTGIIEIVQNGVIDTVSIYYEDQTMPDSLECQYKEIKSVVVNGKTTKTLETKTKQITGKASGNGKSYELDVKYLTQETNAELNVLKDIFTYRSLKPTVYQVNGLSKTVTVKAFNPNEWKISFHLPPLKGMKMGAELDNSKEITTTTSNWETTTETSNNKTETKSTNLFQKFVQVTCDGKDQECKLDILNAYFGFIKNFTSSIKAFRDSVPQIGWYISLQMKILDGNLSFVKGLREDNNHEVYNYWAVAADMTLFQITLEVGFGAMVRGVGAQICIQFKGECKAKVAIDALKPRDDSIPVLDLKPAIELGGYVRLQASGLLKIVGAIKGGISITFNIDIVKLNGKVDMKPEFNYEIKWDAVIALVSATSIVGFSYNKSITLRESSSIMKGNLWNSEKEKTRKEYKSVYEVSKVAEKTIKKGYSLRIFKEETVTKRRAIIHNTYTAKELTRIEPHVLAYDMALIIWKHKTELILDEETVSGICHAARKALGIMARKDLLSKKNLRDWLRQGRFDEFVKGDSFEIIIKQHYDIARQQRSTIHNQP